jgi:hypothetical protein
MAWLVKEWVNRSRNRQRFFDGTAAPLVASGKEVSVHVRGRHNHMSGKGRYFKAVDEQISVSVCTADN